MTDARFVGPFDRLLYLKQLPGLNGLSLGELAVLGRQLTERQFDRGEKLLSEESPISSLYIIVEGSVRLEMDGKFEGDSGPQNGVGFMHWLARPEYGIDATALTNVLALEIPTLALLEILEDHFSFYLTMLRSFAGMLYEQIQGTADGGIKRNWDRELILPDRPLDLVERIVVLRRSPILENVGLETIALLASSISEKRFESGARIWTSGDTAENIVTVLSGRIRCSVGEDACFFAEGGYSMGAIESLAQKPHWYEAVVETETTVFVGNSSVFLDALEDHFDMAMTYLRSMAEGYLENSRREFRTKKTKSISG